MSISQYMHGSNFEQKNEVKTNYYEQDKTFISVKSLFLRVYLQQLVLR